MTRIALIYGGISGLIVILIMMLGLLTSEGQGFFSSEYFGYLIMLIALSMIFMGVKRYRDNDLGGVIRFLPALGLGVMISAVAGVMYVAVWETYQYSVDYAFIHEYVAGLIEAKKTAGVSGAELEAYIADQEELKANYAKPYIRLPMTFLEIFPVGFLVSLVSAALLRNPKLMPARS